MTGTVILSLLFAFAALAYVLWPIVRQDAPPLLAEDDRFTDLLARKDRALRSIKELEFDHQVGKISDEDFQRFNYRLRHQAIALIQQVEKLTPATNEVDEAIEAQIAKLRQVSAPARHVTPATNGTTVTATEPATATGRYCTECGTKLEPGFKFCASCGTPVAVAVATN